MNFLIVGLGNPGKAYKNTRHNAGEDLIDLLADSHNATFREEDKFLSSYCSIVVNNHKVHLSKPHRYMNESGLSVSKVCNYLDIPLENTLIMHDDLDLPHGIIRLKDSGGHGGHNGLRDIENSLGSATFKRLRIGIGHPGKSSDVTNYVLSKFSSKERETLEKSMEASLIPLNLFLEGSWEEALLNLHTIEK